MRAILPGRKAVHEVYISGRGSRAEYLITECYQSVEKHKPTDVMIVDDPVSCEQCNIRIRERSNV